MAIRDRRAATLRMRVHVVSMQLRGLPAPAEQQTVPLTPCAGAREGRMIHATEST